jgi:hypothetical protein
MSDRRPERIYGVLVREGHVFLRDYGGGRLGLPGGVFPPLAENRKGELRLMLFDQLGIDAQRTWAQGAFDYRDPADEREAFSGFYTVWEWQGEVRPGTGRWVGHGDIAGLPGLAPSLRILLLSILDTVALRTT